MYSNLRRSILLVCLPILSSSLGRCEPPFVDRYGDPLPPGAAARLGTVRSRHPLVVGFLAGRQAVGLGRFRWHGSLDAANDFFGRLAFSADGRMLSSVGFHVHIRNSATGRQLLDLKNERRFAFAPDGATLVTRSKGKMIRKYDIPSGSELRRFSDPNNPNDWPLVLSPTGGRLLGRPRTVRVWFFCTLLYGRGSNFRYKDRLCA